MNVYGIGTDMVQISRIRDLFEKYGERFTQRILSASEQIAFKQHNEAIAYLAKRFAGKEAVAKALGTGIGSHLAFTQISITNQANGKPVVSLLGEAKQYFHSMEVGEIMISLSDEKEYALAFVVALKQ
ncbi:holo-ACP synthase [Candidatus Berkiella aquae]|uniref:Holo-[acyl-carrier-protein] synthase n=1 Tax=Candidatus Berkiella aquae TaxID=295108 RepID=A0A0Q9YKK7_9GAMM|nr:holo-ACP synthase [Candidatus Berkiella aquae]MCS5711089.1 holo-ACP synthase [Candidatus Berkiella aquae]